MRQPSMGKIMIVTGSQGEGKTKYCQRLITEFKKKNVKVGGFIAKGTWHKNERHSFELINVKTFESFDLATRSPKDGWEKVGPFYFNPQTLKKGEEMLRSHAKNTEYLFLDEIGKFEMKAKIWGPVFQQLLKLDVNMVITVRDIFVKDIIEHFDLSNYQIMPCNKLNLNK